MRLIDYTNEYLILLDALNYSDECDLEDKDIKSKLDAIQQERLEKLESCGWVYRQCVAEESALEDEIRRLTAKKDRAARNAEKIKNYIAYCLQNKSEKTKSFSFSFRKSESIEILDAEKIPDAYCVIKTTRQPVKSVIKADLKCGASIEGCTILENINLTIK